MVSIAPNHINVSLIRAGDRQMVWQYSWLADDTTKWTGLHPNDSKGHSWYHSPVSIATAPEHFSLFLISEDNSLYQANFDLNDTGEYTQWVKVGGLLAAPPGVAFENGVVHIFTVGMDRILRYKTWTFKTGAYKPSGEDYMEIDREELFNADIIPAGVNTGNDVSVFVVGRDENRLYRYNIDGKRKKDPLPGTWIGGLKAVSLMKGEWDLFGISKEGHLNHLYYRNGHSIQLEILHRASNANDQVLGIDAVDSKDGKMELFFTTHGREVHHSTLNSNRWRPWGLVSQAGIIATPPKAVVHAAGALAVFGLDEHGVAWGNVRDRKTTQWSGWFGLPSAGGMTENVG
ncbi:hypothetical protein M422DRAFT_253867 [Sphaerobolus stellatus SS14]|uniref:Fucose-specific lectin n=1 Tax=Sphaerobolus stellatus (strain SS14) TaxID=990650 RepID=A0A0C9VVQ7_SPHS4|nr:hypothetical protein M422DRAFT_253867 [Sphaerobolus stellatus SS14]